MYIHSAHKWKEEHRGGQWRSVWNLTSVLELSEAHSTYFSIPWDTLVEECGRKEGRKDLKAPSYAALNDEVESRDEEDVYSPAKIARPSALNCAKFYDDDVTRGRERGVA